MKIYREIINIFEQNISDFLQKENFASFRFTIRYQPTGSKNIIRNAVSFLQTSFFSRDQKLGLQDSPGIYN
jgi:hypothetical protein